MNIHQCELAAKNSGHDSMEFDADFPTGTKRCRWLDAYFGLFLVDGLDGFIRTDDADRQFPNLECRIVEAKS